MPQPPNAPDSQREAIARQRLHTAVKRLSRALQRTTTPHSPAQLERLYTEFATTKTATTGQHIASTLTEMALLADQRTRLLESHTCHD